MVQYPNPEPSHDDGSHLGKTNKTPCESPSSAFLHFGASSGNKQIVLPPVLLSYTVQCQEKRCATEETSHPVYSQLHRRTTGTESSLAGDTQPVPGVWLDVVKRRGNIKPSSSNSQAIVQCNILTEKRITAPLLHCHTYKVTCLYATTGVAKQVFWFSSILNTLFGGISDSINSEAARSQG